MAALALATAAQPKLGTLSGAAAGAGPSPRASAAAGRSITIGSVRCVGTCAPTGLQAGFGSYRVHGTTTLQVPVLHAGRVTLTAQMADGSTRSTGWSQSVAARRW